MVDHSIVAQSLWQSGRNERTVVEAKIKAVILDKHIISRVEIDYVFSA